MLEWIFSHPQATMQILWLNLNHSIIHMQIEGRINTSWTLMAEGEMQATDKTTSTGSQAGSGRAPSRRTHGAGGVPRGGAATRQQRPAEARPSGYTRRRRRQPPVLPWPKTTAPPRRPAAAPRLGLRVAEVHPTRGAAVPFAQTLGAGATVRGAAAALS